MVECTCYHVQGPRFKHGIPNCGRVHKWRSGVQVSQPAPLPSLLPDSQLAPRLLPPLGVCPGEPSTKH